MVSESQQTKKLILSSRVASGLTRLIKQVLRNRSRVEDIILSPLILILKVQDKVNALPPAESIDFDVGDALQDQWTQ